MTLTENAFDFLKKCITIRNLKAKALEIEEKLIAFVKSYAETLNIDIKNNFNDLKKDDISRVFVITEKLNKLLLELMESSNHENLNQVFKANEKYKFWKEELLKHYSELKEQLESNEQIERKNKLTILKAFCQLDNKIEFKTF